MKFFLTASTKHLQSSLEKHGCPIGRYETFAFADGERGYHLEDDVQGEPVAVIASVLPDPGSLFDLLALYRLLRENDAAETSLIIPYLGYARQDRPVRKGEAGIGLMVAELLRRMKAHKLILCDVHSDRIRKAFGTGMIEASALPLFAAALDESPPEVIVAPDAGAAPRAVQLAGLLEHRAEVALIDKVRPRPNVAVAKHLRGEVRGRSVLIIDDMIDTGGTLAEAVALVSEKGAASIRLAATHGIFSGAAKKQLAGLPVSEVLITNTLPQHQSRNMRILDVVPLFLDALK